jgi:hypothetical protein
MEEEAEPTLSFSMEEEGRAVTYIVVGREE